MRWMCEWVTNPSASFVCRARVTFDLLIGVLYFYFLRHVYKYLLRLAGQRPRTLHTRRTPFIVHTLMKLKVKCKFGRRDSPWRELIRQAVGSIGRQEHPNASPCIIINNFISFVYFSSSFFCFGQPQIFCAFRVYKFVQMLL